MVSLSNRVQRLRELFRLSTFASLLPAVLSVADRVSCQEAH
jgi:hypothetical protein